MLRSRGFTAIGAIVGAVLGGSVMAAGCSLVLDFSDPPGPPDAMVADAIAAGACDFHEPNDSRDAAMPLDPGTGLSAGICEPGDEDFYAITIGDGQTLTIEVLFAQDGARGDLDLMLISDTGAELVRSLSADADEMITCPGSIGCSTALPAGNYFIRVFGFASSTVNGYTLNYTLTGP